MARYAFPQFNNEIENPTVEIDMNSIRDKAVDCLLSVNVVIVTADTSKFGVRLTDMPYTPTWENSEVAVMVATKLLEFEI